MQLENDVQRLKMLKSSYDSQRYSLQDNFMIRYPKFIRVSTAKLECVHEDTKAVEAALIAETDFAITVHTAGGSVKFTERKDGGEHGEAGKPLYICRDTGTGEAH